MRTSSAVRGRAWGVSARTFADFLLFGITSAELVLLARLTPTFTLVDWIYVSQHLLVLGIALTRGSPRAQDRSLRSYVAVIVAYAYPYAQTVYLKWVPGHPVWPRVGFVLVVLGACLSLASLVTLGRSFGIRPALRVLTVSGPYRIVRHPMYLSYVAADIGYNLGGWSLGTVLLVAAGWAAMVYRINAEERMLSRDVGWRNYRSVVPYRLLPGLW